MYAMLCRETTGPNTFEQLHVRLGAHPASTCAADTGTQIKTCLQQSQHCIVILVWTRNAYRNSSATSVSGSPNDKWEVTVLGISSRF